MVSCKHKIIAVHGFYNVQKYNSYQAFFDRVAGTLGTLAIIQKGLLLFGFYHEHLFSEKFVNPVCPELFETLICQVSILHVLHTM